MTVDSCETGAGSARPAPVRRLRPAVLRGWRPGAPGTTAHASGRTREPRCRRSRLSRPPHARRRCAGPRAPNPAAPRPASPLVWRPPITRGPCVRDKAPAGRFPNTRLRCPPQARGRRGFPQRPATLTLGTRRRPSVRRRAVTARLLGPHLLGSSGRPSCPCRATGRSGLWPRWRGGLLGAGAGRQTPWNGASPPRASPQASLPDTPGISASRPPRSLAVG